MRAMLARPVVHSMAMRVYYEDTDASGIVYYANYLKFAERGRTELLRSLGFGHRVLEQEAGVVFTVRRCTADYRSIARLDDALIVETRVAGLGGATLDLQQQICRDGRTLVALDILVACIGQNGRPRRVPAALRTALNLPPGDPSAPRSSPSAIIQKTP